MQCPVFSLPQPSLQMPPNDAWPIFWLIVGIFVMVIGLALFVSLHVGFPKIIAMLLVLPGVLMMFGGWLIDFCIMRPWQDVTVNTWEDTHTIQLPIDCFDHYGYLLHQTTLGLMRAYMSLATGSFSVMFLGIALIRILAKRRRHQKTLKAEKATEMQA